MESRDPYRSRTQNHAAILGRRDPVLHGQADGARRGALSPAQRDAYQENGFLFLAELFTPNEVGRLYQEMQIMREDYAATGRDEVITEPGSGEVRSIFNIHRLNDLFANLVCDPRVLNVAREILCGEVYIHQSRINYKPGFKGKEFYWHSDFETWHSEDGMPAMRAVSCSILLTDNNEHNGPLMLIPGSQHYFIACMGKTPDDHYKHSLKQQEYGVPDEALLRRLCDLGGIASCTGRAGSAVFFDCNTMHGSNSNITPHPRSNIFFVYNSTENQLGTPGDGLKPRPEFVAARHNVDALTTRPLSIG
jgi:ectoine hydroxylase